MLIDRRASCLTTKTNKPTHHAHHVFDIVFHVAVVEGQLQAYTGAYGDRS